MKTKTKKKVVSGLLGMLLAVVCFIPMSFSSAKAEGNTIATTSLTTKLTGSSEQELTVQTYAGLTGLWSNNTAAWAGWSYDLNATFYGDSKIDFANVRKMNGGYTFAISDLSGNRVLDYHIGTKSTGEVGGNSIAFVKVASENWNVFTLNASGEQKRLQLTPGTNYQGSINEEDRTALQESAIFLPNTINYNEDNTATAGYFGLKFTNDSVAVIASTSVGEKEVANLPFETYTALESLENGYTVDVIAYTDGTNRTIILGSGYNTRPPMLLAINGVTLSGETVALSQETAVVYDGEYVKDNANYIDLVQGSDLQSFAVENINYFTSGDFGKVVTSVTEGEPIAYEESFASKDVGVYDITVSGKAYKVNVLPSMDTANLAKKVTSAKEMEEMAVGTKRGKTGLYTSISSTEREMKWEIDLNGTFQGNSKIEFVNHERQLGHYTFAIYNLEGERLFSYSIGTAGQADAVGGNMIGFVKVESEASLNTTDTGVTVSANTKPVTVVNWYVHTLDSTGEKKATHFSYTEYNAYAENQAEAQESAVFLPNNFAWNAASDAEVDAGYFGVNVTDTAISVVASTKFGEKEVANLPYADYPELVDLQEGYKMKMFSMNNGDDRHKLFGSSWAIQVPMLLAINGVALDQNKVAVSKTDEISYEGEYVEDGKNYIELQKGNELAAFDVVTNNALLVQDVNYGAVVHKATSTVNASEVFAEKEVGEYNLTVASANGTKNYTVLVNSYGKVLSANLTLSDDVVVNYTVSLDAGCTQPKATFTFNGNDTVVEEYEVVDGKYVFSFEGVTPQYLHKDIDIRVTATYEGQSQVVCEKKGFSVRDYCEGMLAKSATDLDMTATKYAALQTLLVDLLNYGAAAQTAASVDVDDLANKNLSNEQKALATAYTTPTSRYAKSAGEYAVSVKAASLYLDRKVIIALAIDCGNLDAQDLTIKVLAGGKTYTYDANEFNEVVVGGVTCQEVRFGGTLATDFDREIKVQVFSGNEAVSAEVTYSVNTFIARNENDLMKSLYSYGVAAAAYVVAQ